MSLFPERSEERKTEREKSEARSSPRYFLRILRTLLRQYGVIKVEISTGRSTISNSIFVRDIRGHPVDLSTTNLLRAGLRICGYLPACLPTWFTDSRWYSRRKCVPTSRTRLRGRLGSPGTAQHGTEQNSSAQVYTRLSRLPAAVKVCLGGVIPTRPDADDRWRKKKEDLQKVALLCRSFARGIDLSRC